MTYKNILRVGFIAIFGLAIWTTLLSLRPHADTTLQTANLPDGYMEGVVALILDKQGKPSMKVETPRMVHYANEDTSHLTSPHLTLYRKSPQPWYITAKFGKATQGSENVDFWENVHIQHAADFDSPNTEIQTTKLTVHPNKKTAKTNEHITMIQPNLTVNAIGMEADMNTGDIKLLSEARGEYVPG